MRRYHRLSPLDVDQRPPVYRRVDAEASSDRSDSELSAALSTIIGTARKGRGRSPSARRCPGRASSGHVLLFSCRTPIRVAKRPVLARPRPVPAPCASYGPSDGCCSRPAYPPAARGMEFTKPDTKRKWPDNWIIATNIDPSGTPETGGVRPGQKVSVEYGVVKSDASNGGASCDAAAVQIGCYTARRARVLSRSCHGRNHTRGQPRRLLKRSR